ncbi:E3 ubiquitin-protein ligase TRIM71-like [Saccostrea echinata]|uniref:E3 ubiquitin-protein ligase TRIM71-like n=1 Tax=Saccostrea echinata TaxID=191078 RepID=UPI002A80ECF5|nr:E3 ubiquitin-protein ligase TRIM71-like [Saccostrea echinata]
MASSTFCDHCTEKEVQLHCISCEHKLCKECVGSHSMTESTHAHKIVKYAERHAHIPHPFCLTHSKSHCDEFCKDCDIPICSECQTGAHEKHATEELPKLFHSKKTEILEDTHALEESLIPKYIQEEMVTKSKTANLTFSYTAMEKQAESFKRKWLEEAHKVFTRLAREMHAFKEEDMAPLYCHEDKIKTGLLEMRKTMEKNRGILKTGKVSEIMGYTSSLGKFQELPHLDLEPSLPTFLSSSAKENVYQVQLDDLRAFLVPATYLPSFQLSPISRKVLVDQVVVIATVKTPYHTIRDLACAGFNKIWVNAMGDDEDTAVSLLDICGDKLETVTVGSFCNGLTMDPHERLLYSEFNNVMAFQNGEVDTLLEMPEGWEAMGVFCSKTGNLFVCLINQQNKEHKVLVYKDKTISKEFQFDENGKNLYKKGDYMLFPRENINGDVVVVDHNSNSVTAVSREGKLRFRYDGKAAKLEKPLNTNDIVTDSMGHIILADEANDSLHIINQNGQFLKCLKIPGLTKPTGLSLDTRERLWVGSQNNGDIKVIQYTKYTS